MNESDEKKTPRERRGSLCPECGHAFEAHIDRLMGGGSAKEAAIECPVCGCGKCTVGRE